MSIPTTAAEAAAILRDLARGREDGDGADVWPLYDRAEDAMAAVVALDLAATRLESERAAERARAAAAEADRDYWHAQATMAAPCVDAVRALTLRLIPGGTGCAVDPERVVAAVDGLRAECDRIDRLASRQAGEYMEAAHGLAIERDAARRAATLAETERDTLRALTDSMRADNVRLRGIVAAVRHERAARAAWLATLPACATAPADVVAAEAATGAALAGEGR